jgi:hypothetical protein
MKPDPLPDVFDLMRQRGPFRCACGAPVGHPMGACEGCSIRYEAAELEAILRPARESIPPRFRWAELATAAGCRAIAEMAGDGKRIGAPSVAAVRGIPRPLPCGIALVGVSGAGKSTLACALLRSVHDWAKPGRSHEGVERARRAFFVSALDLEADAEARRFGRETEGPDLVARAKRATILVLDNVEPGSTTSAVGRVLFARHDQNDARIVSAPRLVTVITTYMDRDEFSRSYGGGVGRRAYEHTVNLVPEATNA